MIQICGCGAQAGYPHHHQCPFPYFGTDPIKVARWDREWEAIQRAYLEARRGFKETKERP